MWWNYYIDLVKSCQNMIAIITSYYKLRCHALTKTKPACRDLMLNANHTDAKYFNNSPLTTIPHAKEPSA